MSASSPPRHDLPHELAEVASRVSDVVERALQLPDPERGWWSRPGVSPRAERWLEAISTIVMVLVASAWIWTIVDARTAGRSTVASAQGETAARDSADIGTEPIATPVTRTLTAAIANPGVPTTAYLTDAALEAFAPLRGKSGKVRVVMQLADADAHDELPDGATVTGPGGAPATGTAPGVWGLAARAAGALRPVKDLSVITLTPLSARKGGKIGLYFIGSWPTEGGRRATGAAARGNYAAPTGLIEVTRENQNTQLSEHLRLRDFLTHNQENVWPKYVVVQSRLIDKDELVLADLEARGIPAKGFHVMSGFRTPSYNAGGGNTTGRAGLSRHMYGDANDMWIDNNGDGQMDDLNRDGRLDIRDSQVVCDAVERVERQHPELVGGCGVYPGNGAHGPFTHIDARGYRARWTGSGNGG